MKIKDILAHRKVPLFKAQKHVPYTTIPPGTGKDRTVVDLTAEGFPEIPAVGMRHSVTAAEGSVLHRHRNGLEITLCVRGCVKFDCGSSVYALLPGMMFVARPGDAHRIRSNPKGACRYTLLLRFSKSGSFLGLPQDEAKWLFERFSSFPRAAFMGTEEIRRSFVRLLELCGGIHCPVPERRLKIRTVALALVLAVAEAGNASAGTATDSGINAIIVRMRRHPERDFKINALTEELGLSANTILARFRRLTGLPPHAFLVKCRIHRAGVLLRRTSRTVTDIAMELGFSSSQHFATCFKQETGLTPCAWRVQKNARQQTCTRRVCGFGIL